MDSILWTVVSAADIDISLMSNTFKNPIKILPQHFKFT